MRDATDGTAVEGATTQLQKNLSGMWENVTGKTNITTSTGEYHISTSEPTAGTYQYRTVYDGNDIYANATSSIVNVNVQAGWGQWTSKGGQLLAGTGPAAYSWGSDRTGWFATGTNHQVYHMWNDSTGTHGWENLGGYLTSSPSTTSPTNDVIDVFARGTNGAVYEKSHSVVRRRHKGRLIASPIYI